MKPFNVYYLLGIVHSLKSSITMKQEKISTLLEPEPAFETYNSFYKLCLDDDDDTIRYLHGIVNMNENQRLKLRNDIAEKGFELTPSQLDQYVFILLLAIYDHASDCHDDYT